MSPTVAQRRMRLATRVVMSATASGALAGALAAASAVIAIDYMVGRHADRRLAGAAEILAGEIDEESDEDDWEPLGEIVADENGELVTSGVRLAAFSGDHRIAGDPWVPVVAAGQCETHGALGNRVRACGRTYRDWLLVAAARSDEAALRWIYALATLGSLLGGALFGTLASLRLTRWALDPLTRLTASIRRLQPDAADPEQLGPRSSCDEIELIRDALSDLLRRSQVLVEQSQRFAADAAHELRTPLTTIRGEIDLLLEDGGASSQRDPMLRVAQRAKQLADLVDRLLVLASPIDRQKQGYETVAMSEIIGEVVSELPAERRARVAVELHGEGLTRGDAALLRSMIANAIDNALKFSAAEPVVVTLTDGTLDATAPAARAITIEIRDRGPGVAAEQRERVFEPFFRVHPDATPGHGLGLSLIGHIARAHGGTAEFVAVDRGARLRLTLPAWSRPNAT